MDDPFGWVWQEIAARPTGPMAFRFYLQPAMATIFAVRDGIKDAKAGRPPFFWALFNRPEQRSELLRSGWRSEGKVFLLALALDVIYQLTVLKHFRPFEGLFVAVVLAIVPYVLLRGIIGRLSRTREPVSGSR